MPHQPIASPKAEQKLELQDDLHVPRRTHAGHRTEASQVGRAGQVGDRRVRQAGEHGVVRHVVELRVIERVERVEAHLELAEAAEPDALLQRQVEHVDRVAIQVVAARLETDAADLRGREDARVDHRIRVVRIALARIAVDHRPEAFRV